MARLKVYRTPIGFHDAFVAAPSKKAALAAWGATHDLFARGSADVVTDPALTKEPLAAPGVVIRRSRGTASEQLGALPPLKGATRAMSSAASRPVATAPRPPRPDRRQLDLAERAIEELRAAHARQMRRLCDRIAHLERQRAALVSAHGQALAELDAAREQAAARFEQALEKWRG